MINLSEFIECKNWMDDGNVIKVLGVGKDGSNEIFYSTQDAQYRNFIEYTDKAIFEYYCREIKNS